MRDELRAVTTAARKRRDAHRAYLAAILTAHRAGHSLTAIGRAAGITKQATWRLIGRHAPKEG
jgi:hypothetical protein